MILKTLGILDIISALYIVLLHYGIGNFSLSLLISGYLMLKITISYKALAGYIDFILALYIFKIHFYPSVIDFIPAIYLLQKGLVSL